MVDGFRADLDQLLSQTRERPILDRFRRCERAKEVPKIVSQRMQLKPNRVRAERAAREPRPLNRAFAFLDPLLSRSALVVKTDDILRRMTQVRDDESDAREQLAEVPLHLGDNPTRARPTRRLVVEALVEPLHLVRRSPDRPPEQIADALMQVSGLRVGESRS
jgi:hypothetical protein